MRPKVIQTLEMLWPVEKNQQQLVQISEKNAAAFLPGFVRVGVHFTMSTAELELLGSAVDPWTVVKFSNQNAAGIR